MRLGVIAEGQQADPVCFVGSWNPNTQQCESGLYSAQTTITYGPEACVDSAGQYTTDMSKCATPNSNAPPNCFSGYGPPPAGSVFCATGCGPGQAWDAYSQSCKDLVGTAASSDWIAGLSNNIVIGVAVLFAAVLLTGRR